MSLCRPCVVFLAYMHLASFLGLLLLLFFITPYKAAHKYKKAKIHLKYDLKYKKDINTNIKAHSSSAR